MSESRENLDTTTRFTEALNRRDYKSAEAELDAELEIEDTDIPESTGTNSFRAWLARWDQAWEDWRIDDLQIRPVGEDRAISFFKMIVRGKGSGIELTREDAVLAHFRNGKIARLAYYNDPAQSLEAAGFEE